MEGWWLTAGTTWTWSEERSFRIISFASCPVLPTRCSQFGCEPCSCNSSGSIKEFSGEFFSIEVVKDFSEDSWTEETINWRDERKRPMIIRDLKKRSTFFEVRENTYFKFTLLTPGMVVYVSVLKKTWAGGDKNNNKSCKNKQ
jgi:hypothetical protein